MGTQTAEARARNKRRKERDQRLVINKVSEAVNRFEEEQIGDVNQVVEQLSFLNQNYEGIRNTSVARDDAETFTKLAKLHHDTVERSARESRRADVSNFINKVKRAFPGSDAEDNVDWEVLGQESNGYFNGIFANTFLFGTLEVQPKERRAPQRRKLARKDAPVEQLQKLTREDLENDSLAKENDIGRQRRDKIFTEIKKGEQGFMDVVLDPGSFTQTVENVFQSSFMVRQDALIRVTNKGLPIVRAQEVHEADVARRAGCESLGTLDQASIDADTINQSILTFNLHDWATARTAFSPLMKRTPEHLDNPVYRGTY